MKRNEFLLFVFVMFLMALVIIGYNIFVNTNNPIQTIKKENVVVNTNKQECEKNRNCLLAIRLDNCCTCPEAVAREELNQTLIEYSPGIDYMSKRTGDCSNVVCGPCEPAKGITCINNKCELEK